MTEFDEKLIEKAGKQPRYEYFKIDIMIQLADTDQARRELTNIRWELHDSVQGTI